MSRVARTGLLFVGLLAAAGCNDSQFPGPPLGATRVPPPLNPITLAIVPSSARAGSPGMTVTITITGKEFANGENHMTNWATWKAGGSQQFLSTHYVDRAHVTADIPADLLRQPVSATIYMTTACDQCDSDPNRGSATFVVTQ